MAEFSAHGIAGARVDRIAAASGYSKNLIYIYFQSKEALFTTILQKHLARVYEEIHFTPDDLPGYAGRVFDFAMANPDLMRLLAWFSLEQRTNNPAGRGAAVDAKIGILRKAQKSGQVGATFSPAFLLTAISSLATAWTAINPFGPSLDPEASARPATLRQHITDAVRLLADGKLDTNP